MLGSFTCSHLQSPFDPIRELICKSWDQDVDTFGAVIQPQPLLGGPENSVPWSLTASFSSGTGHAGGKLPR